MGRIADFLKTTKPRNEEGDSMANNGEMPTDGASKTKGFIKELIDTSWSGSNEEQMKAVQLLKGLATSDEPEANDFMKKVDDMMSGMKEEEPQESFVETYLDQLLYEAGEGSGSTYIPHADAKGMSGVERVKARVEKAKAEIKKQQDRIETIKSNAKKHTPYKDTSLEREYQKNTKTQTQNAKNIIKNLKSFISDSPNLLKKAQEGDKKESFYSVDEKDEKKAKLQAEYRKHMDARSDAYQKFVDEKESKHDGSSDKFYNEDPVGYRRMRDEVDKHAAAADKVWDKLQKMK